MHDDALIEHVSHIIHKNYKYLISKYLEITGKGKKHFENETFKELFQGAQQRYNLYAQVVRHTLEALDELLTGERRDDVELWKKFKERYSSLIAHRKDIYIAQTFFNSITRKIFNTVGFNPDVEFIDFSDFNDQEEMEPIVFERWEVDQFSREVIIDILKYYDWKVPYRNIEEDARRIFETIVPHLVFQRGGLQIDCIDFLKMAFYRNRGAFIIGRIRHGKWQMPFIIPVLNENGSLFVDTVIYTPNEVSVVFSFTRASFFAHSTKPVELINFLKELMPHKGLGELYDSIGYYRHGKTILYRDLYRYIHNHDDQFIIAPGIKGMVMTVFTLRHYNFVFKIIKDRFDNPKSVTREQVIQKYRDVELNDRVGRLIYAHNFEHLEFEKKYFSQEVLDELASVASKTVTITEDKVHIKHLYIERRLDPLNLYLQKATRVESIAALIDYGHSIKDMAKANIFPGDLLLKNFGVTRHGRVIFYDYDEIQKVTEIRFRQLPEPRDHYEEFSAEPAFSVGPNDVFPQEFMNFMVPKGAIREVFLEVHGNLFDPKYWRSLQKDIKEGEMLEFFAYDEKKRFEH